MLQRLQDPLAIESLQDRLLLQMEADENKVGVNSVRKLYEAFGESKSVEEQGVRLFIWTSCSVFLNVL